MLSLLLSSALFVANADQPQRDPQGRWIICPGHPRCRSVTPTPTPVPTPVPMPATQTCPDGSVVAAEQPCPALPGPFLVYFDADSTALTEQGKLVLDQVAAAYQASGGRVSVALAAHTDRVGNAAANVALSRRYADAVRAYLVMQGIPEAGIATAAFGESLPLVETGDEIREPLNRRVEISLGPAAPAR